MRKIFPFNLFLASIAFAVGVALFLASPQANAFGDIIVNDKSVHQKQGQQQQQGQQQGQILNNRTTQANKQSNKQSLNNTNRFEDRRQIPGIAIAAPSFGSSVSDGFLNACAGSEAWSVSLGASFVIPGGGAPIAGGIGGGSNDIVTINLCEVREVAHMIAMRMEGDTAEKLWHSAMCHHPTYLRAAASIGLVCPPVQSYSMEVATQETIQSENIQLASSGCEYGRNEWGRCVNPDLD
jgi:hypothetical protein